MTELAFKLESNKPEEVQLAKQKFHEQFNIGMFLLYSILEIHNMNIMFYLCSKRIMAVEWIV